MILAEFHLSDLCQVLLQCGEKVGGPSHPGVLDALQALTDVLRRERKLLEAEEACRALLKVTRRRRSARRGY
jgi:hypothetical protein